MNKNEFIITVLSYMQDRTQIPFVEAELSNHIEDRMDFYLDAGYSYDEAEKKALKRMGDAKELGIKMNLLHDCRKLNTASKVCIILLAIIFVVFNIIYYSIALNDIWIEAFGIIIYLIFYSLTFIISAILYCLCTKTKNYKFALSGSIIALLFYFISIKRDTLYNIAFGFLSIFDLETFKNGINFGNIGSFLILLIIIILALDVINNIIFLGFSANLKLIYKNESKTNILSRYEAFRFVPIIEIIILLTVFIIAFVTILKGA